MISFLSDEPVWITGRKVLWTHRTGVRYRKVPDFDSDAFDSCVCFHNKLCIHWRCIKSSGAYPRLMRPLVPIDSYWSTRQSSLGQFICLVRTQADECGSSRSLLRPAKPVIPHSCLDEAYNITEILSDPRQISLSLVSSSQRIVISQNKAGIYLGSADQPIH
jgi:hypothetical protein